jgi:iron transport multicopper oxidase
VDGPAAPFGLQDVPAAGTVVAPGGSLAVHATYSSLVPGPATGALTLRTSAGSSTVALNAAAVTSGALTVTPAEGWAFGDVAVGETAEQSVTLANTGTGDLRVLDSAAPAGAGFAAVDGLPAGTVLSPGDTVTVRVAFTPSAAGAASDVWRVATTAAAGSQLIALSGAGVLVDAPVEGGAAELPPTPAPPNAPAAPLIGVDGQGPVIPARVKPDLHVSKLAPSRDGRTLAVRGRVAKLASGPVAVTVRAKVGRKTVTVATSARLPAGRSTYAFSVTVPKAMRKWSRIQVTLRYAGSTRVWPGSASMALVRAR